MKRVKNRVVVEVISTRDRRLMTLLGACFLVARLKFEQQHGILSKLPVSENNRLNVGMRARQSSLFKIFSLWHRDDL